MGARDSQQDCFEISNTIKLTDGTVGCLLIVADGMGGHLGGFEASKIVVDEFTQAFAHVRSGIAETFEQALNQSNYKIGKFVTGNPKYDGMGSTVVAVLIVEQTLYWLSVGDSPLWLIRNGQMQRLNEDHSLLPVLLKMADMGEITTEEAHQDPKKHMLRSVIQGKPIKLIDSQFSPFALHPSDKLILASDGLHTLADDTICTLVNTSSNKAVDTLLKKIDTISDDNQDNTSVIIAMMDTEAPFKVKPLQITIMLITIMLIVVLIGVN
ncbi:MAG: serine/threonine-protein phosphatase [Algicola sp.]|nr:serine/threonine-protein phosphatase [Algicola sp.]